MVKNQQHSNGTATLRATFYVEPQKYEVGGSGWRTAGVVVNFSLAVGVDSAEVRELLFCGDCDRAKRLLSQFRNLCFWGDISQKQVVYLG